MLKLGLGVDRELSCSESYRFGNRLHLRHHPAQTLHLQGKILRPKETVLLKVTKLVSVIALIE